MQALYEVFRFLKQINAVDTHKEFCTDWLGRSENYFRTLKHYNRSPSIKVIAVLSYKLQHYGNALKRQNDATKAAIGNQLLKLHDDCEQCLHERCASVWRSEMG